MKRETKLLTPKEAAAYLNVKPRTVTRWCREGSLPARKIGRVWRIHPEALIDKAELG